MKNFKNLLLITLFLGVFFMPNKAKTAEMTVSAAASLTDAFNELKTVFEKEHPDLEINANYAASNPLLRQILAGAPADILATADQATMNSAAESKVIDPSTRKNFARNELVLIVPKGGNKPAKLEDLLQMDKIAIGNPDSVPAGRYARAALEKAGLWDKLQGKFIQGGSVRQALEYVDRGEVDACFVYRTDAAQKGDSVDIVMTVEGHEPVTYPIAVCLGGSNMEAGKAFVNFVLSPKGQEILAKHGFAKP